MKVERKEYSRDDLNEIVSQIQKVVSYYRFTYRNDPITIILSQDLMAGLRYTMFDYLEYNPLNNIHKICGIECKESPVLTDLEYKVY